MAAVGQQGWQPIDWCPKDLQVGDRVGLLIATSGDAWVVHNGRRVVKSPGKIAGDKPLYPFIDLLGNTAGVTLLPHAQPPLAFRRQICGRYVCISKDSLSAKHQDPTGHELKGLVFLSVPMPVYQEGAYFEVRVDEVCTGNADGLTMGATIRMPSPDDRLAQVSDELHEAWSMGYDGEACHDGHMVRIGWRPCDLKVGDRVGFLVTSEGAAWIVENGSPVARMPGKVPADRPLYGFVDLLGNTTKVTLIEGAAPPGSAGVPLLANAPGAPRLPQGGLLSSFMSIMGGRRSGKQPQPVLETFDKSRVSQYVSLSRDGLTAVHSDASNEVMQGVLFGDAPIERFADQVQYFEVRVDELRQGFPDGLVVGVTSEIPPPDAAFLCADEVPSSWSFGYDGAFARVLGESEEPEEGAEKLMRFRNTEASLYRVSRFSASAFRLSYAVGAGQHEDEDEEEEAAGAEANPKEAPPKKIRGTQAGAPKACDDFSDEEEDGVGAPPGGKAPAPSPAPVQAGGGLGRLLGGKVGKENVQAAARGPTAARLAGQQSG